MIKRVGGGVRDEEAVTGDEVARSAAGIAGSARHA
jgi:hypothetical protein